MNAIRLAESNAAWVPARNTTGTEKCSEVDDARAARRDGRDRVGEDCVHRTRAGRIGPIARPLAAYFQRGPRVTRDSREQHACLRLPEQHFEVTIDVAA